MKLIDKDSVVAEIEKLISNGKFKCQQSQENNDQVSYIAWSEHIATCGKILSFLNTLEVKEVDFEKELDRIWFDNKFGDMFDNSAIDFVNVRNICRHFFELGLFSQLSWQDVKRLSEIGETFMNSEESDNLSEEEYYTEILNKFKAKEGEQL